MMNNDLIILFTVILIYQTLMPIFSSKNMVFSVSKSLLYNIGLANLYKKIYIVVGLVLTLINISCSFVNQTLLLIFFLLSTLILIILFGIFHNLLLNQANNSLKNKESKKNIELLINDVIPNVPMLFFAFPICIILGMFILLLKNYDKLPYKIPIHWNLNFVANRFLPKTLWNVSQEPLIMLILIIILLIFNLSLSKKSQTTIIEYKEKYIKMKLNSRRYHSLLLCILSLFLTSVSIVCELPLLYKNIVIPKELVWLLFIVCIITYLIYIKKSVLDENKFLKEYNIEDISLEYDENNWVLGLIYFNKNNPALLIPKRTGFGYTLNLGSPYSWIIIIILLIPIIF
ncbi:DUF1648 domain-containing protein [Clostridium felsineum]|uniref:DUF1648 domain-containing protein n=1 Tax=Clostridium felsineum TaxID=36839 RepID=UPI00214D5CF4|nr:DUF1648 domain-containing protein [Clostridium felsineum]MCR3760684.1 DUF1648 domain-containing protein [Clostridium felsineum]